MLVLRFWPVSLALANSKHHRLDEGNHQKRTGWRQRHKTISPPSHPQQPDTGQQPAAVRKLCLFNFFEYSFGNKLNICI